MTQLSTAPPCTPPTHLTEGARPVSPRPLAGASKHDKLFRQGGPASACPRSHCRGLVRTRVREGASCPWPSAQWKESSQALEGWGGTSPLSKRFPGVLFRQRASPVLPPGPSPEDKGSEGDIPEQRNNHEICSQADPARPDPPRGTSVATGPLRLRALRCRRPVMEMDASIQSLRPRLRRPGDPSSSTHGIT